MAKKDGFELVIGGEYLTQPSHRPKMIPMDFLAHFHNVDSENSEQIRNFANSYSFGGYVVPDKENSIEGKFNKIHSRYSQIILELMQTGTISFEAMQIINKDLESTSPQIHLRDQINDLDRIARGFEIHKLKNTAGEKPEISVTSTGSFDRAKNVAHIKVITKVPELSKTVWEFEPIKGGITKLTEIFPSENWEAHKFHLDAIVLKNGCLKFNNYWQPVSLEMNFWLGKTFFSKEELAATWSPTAGESFIAKRIWDYINSEYVGTKFKLCKYCGELHTGKSQDHCQKDGCTRKYDSDRH